MLFLKTTNLLEKIEKDPFALPQVFLRELDGTMTLSETIELEQGKVLIYEKENDHPDDRYAFVVCWNKRLDWPSFEGIYALYEERVVELTAGHPAQIEPVFIAKSIDNDVLRFLQNQKDTEAGRHTGRTFTF